MNEQTYVIDGREYILTTKGLRRTGKNFISYSYEDSLKLISKYNLNQSTNDDSSKSIIKIGKKYRINGREYILTAKGLKRADKSFISYSYKDSIRLIRKEYNLVTSEDDYENIDSSNSSDKSMVAKIMESMAMIKTPEARRKLKNDARGCTLNDWKLKNQAKCGGVGFMTGLLGGPVGLALEGADTGYLIAMAGQACYGVGHILNKEIDYDKDIEGILAIWSGVGKNASKEDIDLNTGAGLALLPIGGKMAVKVAGKVAPKLAFKIAAKASTKIIGKAGAKVAGKVAGKMSTKWIPGVGGVVSAAINVWIMETMITAAEKYYKADYIIVDDFGE